ncbi:MAG: hypothetical protein FGM26_10990 [Beijerinckiaceae bacterium]|nr:hypothetical protein [Beijerinckiaceae bacterium]
MPATEPSLPLWLEVVAMATNGLYGAAAARSRNVPVAGTFLAGIMVGLGGGMARDVLLGTEAVAISNPYLIPSVLLSSLIGALFFYRVVAMALPNLIIHGIAFGFLISIGCQRALSLGAPPLSAIFCAILTASVGGMALDALTKHRASAFSQAHWVITTLAIGSTVYYGLTTQLNFYIATGVTVMITALLYTLSITRNWPSPRWPGESMTTDD